MTAIGQVALRASAEEPLCRECAKCRIERLAQTLDDVIPIREVPERRLDVPRGAAKMAVEGACWYNRHVEGLPSPTGDDQYGRLGEPGLHSFIRWVAELFSVKTPELRRQTIVAAMYGTWVKNERQARKFWAEVARGSVEYEDSHPTTVLDAWLKAAIENRGQNRELKPAQFYQGSIFAWNAYRGGKTITSIRSDTKKGVLDIDE